MRVADAMVHLRSIAIFMVASLAIASGGRPELWLQLTRVSPRELGSWQLNAIWSF